jgi:hypothetical protein
MNVKMFDIEGLHQIVKAINKYEHLRPTAPILYKGKIKLHGTNSSVACYTDGRIVAQSKEQELINGLDNAGFAKWVAIHEQEFKQLVGDRQVTIFGEWCGKGINKGCAIHQIDKTFVIFFVQFNENEDGIIVSEPERLKEILKPITGIHILPWYQPVETLMDFNNVEQLREQADKLSKIVVEIEECDPWVKETFGVVGVCEGFVMYPVEMLCRKSFSQFIYKCKGEKHQVKVQKQAAIVDPEIVKGVADFVNMFVTDNRCEQGVSVACGGQLDRKLTGQFLKWLCSDVAKESKAELEASGLTWDQVSKTVQVTAQKWWLAKTGKI